MWQRAPLCHHAYVVRVHVTRISAPLVFGIDEGKTGLTRATGGNAYDSIGAVHLHVSPTGIVTS